MGDKEARWVGMSGGWGGVGSGEDGDLGWLLGVEMWRSRLGGLVMWKCERGGGLFVSGSDAVVDFQELICGLLSMPPEDRLTARQACDSCSFVRSSPILSRIPPTPYH